MFAGLFFSTVVHSFFQAEDDEVEISNSYVTIKEVGIHARSTMKPRIAQTMRSGTSRAIPKKVALETTDFPVRISMPRLQIGAGVQKRGLTAQGNMATPNNFKDAAWYKYGTVPGNRGSAVVTGHLDNALGLAGVFGNLHNINVGEQITVIMDSGGKINFTVYAVETYNHDEVPVDLIFHKNDGIYLNLITCEGAWLKKVKSYDRRLVVFAKKETPLQTLSPLWKKESMR